MSPGIRVLFVAGWGRSGSTVLGGILSRERGLDHFGEVCYLWERGRGENRLCGCGAAFRSCPFWREVWVRAVERVGAGPLEAGLDRLSGVVRVRHVPGVRLWAGSAAAMDPEGLSSRALGALYESIVEVSRCEVVVDSSKLPLYAYLLASVPGIDLKVIHLVRDPRAVAHSWSRSRFDPGSRRLLARHGAARSTLSWVLVNEATEAFFRGAAAARGYARMRYEDLVARPEATLRSALDALELEAPSAAAFPGGSVDLPLSHTVSGNPGRFQRGPVELKEDDEWKRAMRLRDRLVATALSLPLLSRYGYPFRGGAG